MSIEFKSANQMVKTITTGLRRQADPRRAQASLRFFKPNENVVLLGLETATLRRFVKEQVKPLKQTWTLKQAITCCDELLHAKELEIRASGFLVLAAFKKSFTIDLTTHSTRWLKTCLDNWGLVDGFCSEVLTPLLAQYPDVEQTLTRLSVETKT
jgi:3-methyladenine DNA glycosylase AlkD